MLADGKAARLEKGTQQDTGEEVQVALQVVTSGSKDTFVTRTNARNL